MLVFIDGASGATGLTLAERLSAIDGVELIAPEETRRRDLNTRREYLNKADAVFLCLPDGAAKESVSLIESADTVVIDASTAHRTAEGWAYGFPELSPAHYNAVKSTNRIAVPGCHAHGFCALVYPLAKAGLLGENETVFCNSLTGYSGGGKKMIADYENGCSYAASAYSLTSLHKHIPEMKHVCELKDTPIFQPVVVNAYRGMLTSVPVAKSARNVWEILNSHYMSAGNAGSVSVMPLNARETLVLDSPPPDSMEIYVFGDETHAVITAWFDNLGKGSAGAAVQCFRLRMGL